MVIWPRLLGGGEGGGGQRWSEEKGMVILRFHNKTLED